MPTPESSEGTALNVFALPTLGGPDVTDVFRTLLVGCPPAEPATTPPGAATAFRVLPSHPGRLETTLVMLPVVIFESTVLTRFLLVIVGLAPVRRLVGLSEPTTLPAWLGSGLRNRPPNLDSFSD